MNDQEKDSVEFIKNLRRIRLAKLMPKEIPLKNETLRQKAKKEWLKIVKKQKWKGYTENEFNAFLMGFQHRQHRIEGAEQQQVEVKQKLQELIAKFPEPRKFCTRRIDGNYSEFTYYPQLSIEDWKKKLEGLLK